jgi:hypothetical protein
MQLQIIRAAVKIKHHFHKMNEEGLALLQQVTEAFILSLMEWRKPPKNTQL